MDSFEANKGGATSVLSKGSPCLYIWPISLTPDFRAVSGASTEGARLLCGEWLQGSVKVNGYILC